MRPIFVDTSFWIAVVKKDDKWNGPAIKAYEKLNGPQLVTTDEVLIEFLNHLARYGEKLSAKAAEMARKIMSNPNVNVIPQTRATFLEGLASYEDQLAKGYSLTDCIGMNVMRAANIRDALTSDLGFEREGFNVLVKSNDKGRS